jgi:hypothetical protein
LPIEVLPTTGIELVLVEILGTLVAWLNPLRTLEGTLALKRRALLLDASSFDREQLAGSIGVHTGRLLGERINVAELPLRCGNGVDSCS